MPDEISTSEQALIQNPIIFDPATSVQSNFQQRQDVNYRYLEQNFLISTTTPKDYTGVSAVLAFLLALLIIFDFITVIIKHKDNASHR